jgi:hypothetical protein
MPCARPWCGCWGTPLARGGCASPALTCGPHRIDTDSGRPRCSGLRTVTLGLANMGGCGPAIGANPQLGGPTLSANQPTLVCEGLANTPVGQHVLRTGAGRNTARRRAPAPQQACLSPPHPLSPWRSGAQRPRSARRAEGRRPRADGVTLRSARAAAAHAERRALRPGGY